MKKIFLSAASLAVLSGSALAADLPSRKEAIVAPVVAPPWQGFYAGLNAGYGWGTNSNNNSSLSQGGSWNSIRVSDGYVYSGAPYLAGALSNNNFAITQSGFIGGAQFGYNYQFTSNFVVGFETDFQGTTTRGQGSSSGVVAGGSSSVQAGVSGITYGNNNGYGVNVVSAGLNYLGTARGRVGYLWSQSLLTYGTAGLAYGGAWANVDTNAASTTQLSNTQSAVFPSVSQIYIGGGNSNSFLVGYSAGGGVEWMFMPNWSLKVEALYYNLGSMNVSSNAIAAPAQVEATNLSPQRYAYAGLGVFGGRTELNYQGVIARAGVNYHFNIGSMPVVAKF